MKTNKAVLGVLLVVVVILLAWWGYAATTQQSKEGEMSIGLNPWIGNGLYYVAEEKGFFEQEGLTVNLVDYADGATGKQLMNSGKLDVASLTPEAIVILADAGIPVKAVATTDTSLGADGIVASSDINNLADLRGKSVAFEVGSPSHFYLSYLLNEQGMTTDDLTVVNEAAPDAGASFVAGNVDAAVTWEPWLSAASDREGGHLIASTADTPLLPAMLTYRAEVLEERPADAKATLRALFAAGEWIKDNEAEAVSIMAKRFDITEEEVQEQLPTLKWLTYEENLAEFTKGEFSGHNLIQKAGDLWLQLGLTDTEINADTLVDTSILSDLN